MTPPGLPRPISIRSRLGSIAIDLIAFALFTVAGAYLVGEFSAVEPEAPWIRATVAAWTANVGLWSACAFLGLWLCWALAGATPGMALMGSIVVRARTGRRIGFPMATLRLVCLPVSIVTLGVGFAAAFWSPARRTWHDRLSGTLIAYEDEALEPLESLARRLP